MVHCWVLLGIAVHWGVYLGGGGIARYCKVLQDSDRYGKVLQGIGIGIGAQLLGCN